MGVEGDAVFAKEAAAHLDRVVHADLNGFQWAAAFPGIQFDCIIFADVLEHLVDPRRHLIEAQDCLRPGGSFVISLPNIRHVSSLYSIFVKGTFPQRDRGIFDRTHLRWFTIRDAEHLIADVGMKIEAFSGSLRVGDRGDGIVNKIARRVLEPIDRFPPIRQFLSYQFCIRAVKAEVTSKG
jgi:SAM-dependent methyltransferase